MKRALLCSLALVSVLGLSACRHQSAPPPPPPPTPAASPKPAPPAPITVITPLPSVPPSKAPEVTKAAPPAPAPVPKPQPVKHKHRLHKKTTEPAGSTETAAANPAQDASTTNTGGATPSTAAAGVTTPAESSANSVPTPDGAAKASSGVNEGAKESPSVEVPALGQLSTGTAISSSQRSALLEEIAQLEARLKKQPVPTSADGKAVLMQVQSFLNKATQAVADNDLDGARTLNTKARVLLDELHSEE